jgi:CelD/BcsL family acetyltransferase involved in cellulose biosynthesis
MSALYAADELVAVHLGMQTPQVLHCWFPTYRRDMGKYSPGLILLVRLAECAAAAGIQRIDLGKGPERYKYRFASGSSMVAQGAVDCRFAIRVARRSWRNMKQVLGSSLLARPARQPARILYKVRQRCLFR